MNYVDYVASSHSVPASYEECLENPEAAEAFFDWAIQQEEELQGQQLADLHVGSLDCRQRLAALKNLLSQSFWFQEIAHDPESPQWDEMINAHFANFALSVQNGREVTPLVFLAGHGEYSKGNPKILVPKNMTLNFFSADGENLLYQNSLISIAQGPKVKPWSSLREGEPVENYSISPETDDWDLAVTVAANKDDVPLLTVRDIGSSGAAIPLCADPVGCSGKDAHGCNGVLGKMKHVRVLNILACRGSDTGSSRTTLRVPGEKLPVTYFKSLARELNSRATDGKSIQKKLKSMCPEDQAIYLKNSPTATDAMHIEAGLSLLEEKGPIAYYSYYIHSDRSDGERKVLDSVQALRNAKLAAVEQIKRFKDLTFEQQIKATIRMINAGEKGKAHVDFLKARISGYEHTLKAFDLFGKEGKRACELIQESNRTAFEDMACGKKRDFGGRLYGNFAVLNMEPDSVLGQLLQKHEYDAISVSMTRNRQYGFFLVTLPPGTPEAVKTAVKDAVQDAVPGEHVDFARS